LKALADEAWSLTETGKELLQVELARRGLEFVLATAAAVPPETQSSDLVTIRKYRDLPEALLAKCFLESAGVESFLIDETTIRMDWLWSNLLGGIKLCVNPEDAASAIQLLDGVIPEKFTVEGVGDFDQPRCPQCQSLNISLEGSDTRWKCQACGHVWELTDGSKEKT
jgi:hypothetical protein